MTTEPIVNQQELDPLDAAMEAKWNPTYTIFGNCSVDVYYCVLQKGVGKVIYDPTQHNLSDRRTAITLIISPLSTRTNAQDTKRELIAESKDWATVVKPSLAVLQTDLRGINGKWVKAELVQTGTYTKKDTNEVKTSTTLKFVAIYADEAACQAAADELFGANGDSAPATNPPASTADVERETAKKFLPALWASSGKDIAKFSELLARQPLVAKYFDINSAEVLELIAA